MDMNETDALSTILIVEDDRKTAQSIALYLEHGGYRTQIAHSGIDAIEKIRTRDFDLIILDIMLPHLDGFDICQLVRADSDVPLIMLTARTLEEDQLRGFALGADDYIVKPFSPRMLLARVQASLRRRAPMGMTNGNAAPETDVIACNGVELNRARHEVRVRGELVSLTLKEFRLLEVLMRSPGRAFEREELIVQVFGLDYEGLDRSIDTLMMRLRRKIEPEPQQPVYIRTVYGVGYKFADAVQ